MGSRGIKVIGVTDGKQLPGLNSRYFSDFWFCDNGVDATLDLLIEKGKRFSERPVLYPITDLHVRCIALRIEEIISYFRIGLPDADIIESAMSKKGIADLVSKMKLPGPQTFFLSEPNHIFDVIKNLKLPCIIKPEFRSAEFAKAATQKAYFATDSKGLLNFYQSFSHLDPNAVIQQYIPGGDQDIYFCLQYYNSKSECLASFAGRKIRQWPPLCGGTASCEPVDNAKIEKISTTFFTELRFQGLCSMEFKRDPLTGKFFIIEPTVGRTDWQSDIASMNGIPIPYIAYLDLIGEPPQTFCRTKKKYKWVRWFADSQAYEYYHKKGELSLIEWLNSIKPPVKWAVWSAKDPKPMLKLFMNRVSRKFHNTFTLKTKN